MESILFARRRPVSAAGRVVQRPLQVETPSVQRGWATCRRAIIFFASRRRGPTYTPYSLPGPSLHVASSFHAAVIHTDSQSSLHLSLSEKLRYAPRPTTHTVRAPPTGALALPASCSPYTTPTEPTKTITISHIPRVRSSLSPNRPRHTPHTTERRPPALSPLFRTTRTPLFPYALCKHRRHPQSKPKSPDTSISIPFFKNSSHPRLCQCSFCLHLHQIRALGRKSVVPLFALSLSLLTRAPHRHEGSPAGRRSRHGHPTSCRPSKRASRSSRTTCAVPR